MRGKRVALAGRGQAACAIAFDTVRLAHIDIALPGRKHTANLYLQCVRLAREGLLARPLLASSANGQVIYEALRSPAIRQDFDRFDMVSMDGQPPVLISRLWRSGFEERVATTDLLHDVIEAGLEDRVSHYLLGARQPIVERAAAMLRRRHEGVRIAGVHHGYISDDELPAIAAEIEQGGAEVVWLCMGVPREQRLAPRLAALAPRVAVIKTGGGLLDFASGERARAPRWMQAIGLEWAFRIWLEPRRLLGRYLVSNPVALAYLFWTVVRPPVATRKQPTGLTRTRARAQRAAAC